MGVMNISHRRNSVGDTVCVTTSRVRAYAFPQSLKTKRHYWCTILNTVLESKRYLTIHTISFAELGRLDASQSLDRKR